MPEIFNNHTQRHNLKPSYSAGKKTIFFFWWVGGKSIAFDWSSCKAEGNLAHANDKYIRVPSVKVRPICLLRLWEVLNYATLPMFIDFVQRVPRNVGVAYGASTTWAIPRMHNWMPVLTLCFVQIHIACKQDQTDFKSNAALTSSGI